jgi:hypothetical protein
LRKLVVALALGVALLPMSAFAASPPLESINHCVAPFLTPASSFRLTLAQAQHCAAGHDGAFALHASHGQSGYQVAEIHSEKIVSRAGDPCYYRQQSVFMGDNLYIAETMCYNYSTAWNVGDINQSCHQVFPDAWCNSYNTYYHPYSGTDYAELDGNFYATCNWFSRCNFRLWMDQYYDGPFYVGWYNI